MCGQHEFAHTPLLAWVWLKSNRLLRIAKTRSSGFMFTPTKPSVTGTQHGYSLFCRLVVVDILLSTRAPAGCGQGAALSDSGARSKHRSARLRSPPATRPRCSNGLLSLCSVLHLCCTCAASWASVPSARLCPATHGCVEAPCPGTHRLEQGGAEQHRSALSGCGMALVAQL